MSTLWQPTATPHYRAHTWCAHLLLQGQVLILHVRVKRGTNTRRPAPRRCDGRNGGNKPLSEAINLRRPISIGARGNRSSKDDPFNAHGLPYSEICLKNGIMAKDLSAPSVRDSSRGVPCGSNSQGSLMEDCSERIRNDCRQQLTDAEHGKSDGSACDVNVKRTNGSEFVIEEERETTNHYHQQPQEESQQRNTQIRFEARPRTFPISRVITRRRSRNKGVFQVAQALEFLYLGAKSEKQNSVQDAFNDQSHAIASRAMRSLQSRIPLDFQSPKEPSALLHASSDWQIVTELFLFLLEAQPVPSNRGDFKPLDSTRIDLPAQNSHFSSSAQSQWHPGVQILTFSMHVMDVSFI